MPQKRSAVRGSASTSAGGGGPPPGWKEARDAFVLYRRGGHKGLKKLKEVAAATPTAMSHVCLAKVALLEAAEVGGKVRAHCAPPPAAAGCRATVQGSHPRKVPLAMDQVAGCQLQQVPSTQPCLCCPACWVLAA